MFKRHIHSSFPAFTLALFLVPNTPSLAEEFYKRIIAGNVSKPGQFPSTVTFLRGGEDLPGFCTGVIISPEWLITTAYCIIKDIPQNVYVLAGTSKLEGPKGTYASISRFVIHHKFNYKYLTHNLALIRLSNDLVFDANVQKMKFARAPVPSVQENNATCTVVGWGADEDGNYETFQRYSENITVLKSEECEEIFGQKLDKDSEFCAFGNNSNGACNGDFGSPLICNEVVVGLVSYRLESCDSNKPEIYVNIGKFSEWIKEISGIGD